VEGWWLWWWWGGQAGVFSLSLGFVGIEELLLLLPSLLLLRGWFSNSRQWNLGTPYAVWAENDNGFFCRYRDFEMRAV
jgi:hypothetical protein